MSFRTSSTIAATPHHVPITLATTVAVVALGVNLFAGLLGAAEATPFPFVWRDVALVEFVCSLPLATVVACFLKQRTSRLLVMVVLVLSLGFSVAFAFGIDPKTIEAVQSAAPRLSGALLRTVPAFCLALSVSLLSLLLLSGTERQAASANPKFPWPAAILSVLILGNVPTVYISARCRHDANRLADLVEQTRLGEAHELAHGMVTLDRSMVWQGRPLAVAALQLEREVLLIEHRVSLPLPGEASSEQRLKRAQDLAILGKPAAALRSLNDSTSLSNSAEGQLLQATIYETLGKWKQAVHSYEIAGQQFSRIDNPELSKSGLVQATRGVALCERKLGNYSAAETAYLKVLSLQPTADSHFLLAQFYEDTQQTGKAQAHTRQAMQLDPRNYQRKGEQLLDKLVTVHFGCFAASRGK